LVRFRARARAKATENVRVRVSAGLGLVSFGVLDIRQGPTLRLVLV
jgi:hypothetical protein